MGWKLRTPGRRDKELLTGLQHKRNHTMGKGGSRLPRRNMQGQNQACQTSTGDKIGEEHEGQQGRLAQGNWSKKAAKENEAALS